MCDINYTYSIKKKITNYLEFNFLPVFHPLVLRLEPDKHRGRCDLWTGVIF